MIINMYDVIIVGAGLAGVMSCAKLSKDHRGIKVLCIDFGRQFAKRRAQLTGAWGALPSSDGKFYQNDISKVSNITGANRTKKAHNFVKDIFKQVNDYSIIKDTLPQKSLQNKIKKMGLDLSTNNYVQVFPKEIHALSKLMVKELEKNTNLSFSFDNEVYKITKQKNSFLISTEKGEFNCKKLILAAGRAGWRWAAEIYKQFGIVENNDYARFGLRMEMNADLLKDFNKSNCFLSKEDLEIGPFSWNGTVIPEDHSDLAISAFRGNESRWHTEKVSFPIIGYQHYLNKGLEQTDRIGKLTFILSNDRILKEKISSFMNDKSLISVIPEYAWLKGVIKELTQIIPDIAKRAYFHVPTLTALPPVINIGSNMMTEVDNLFVAGESAGITGLLAAACMGVIAADGVAK